MGYEVYILRIHDHTNTSTSLLRYQRNITNITRCCYNSFCSTSLCKTRVFAFYSRIQTSQWVGVGCAVERICQVVKVKQISVSLRYSCSPLSHAPFTMATVRSAVCLSQVLPYCAFLKEETTKDQISHISAGHAFQNLPIPSERCRTMNLGTVMPTK